MLGTGTRLALVLHSSLSLSDFNITLVDPVTQTRTPTWHFILFLQTRGQQMLSILVSEMHLPSFTATTALVRLPASRDAF